MASASTATLLVASTCLLTAQAFAAGPLACTALDSRAVSLVGQGHCVDSRNLTANAYTCTAEPCTPMQDPDTCELVCLGTRGCTGFELVNTSASGLGNNCRVFSSVVPDLGAGLWPWRVENGTQNGRGSGFVVVSGDGSEDACCYKVSYPLPNVNDNPVPIPPLQSEAQKAIFANRSSLAAAASAEALPALESLIDFCANYSTNGGASHLFDAASCPGMADVTQNGTLKPWPNASEILARFSQEARCMSQFVATPFFVPTGDRWSMALLVVLPALAPSRRVWSWISHAYIEPEHLQRIQSSIRVSAKPMGAGHVPRADEC